jgi:hypothetical protein
MSLLNKASLIQIPSGYKDGTLYSAKPTNGDGDFTFSRGSNLAATRVNSDGLIEKGRENLALYSNDFSQSNWQKLNNVVVSGQTATDPYGNANSAWDIVFDGTTSGRIEQGISGVISGGVYAPSIWARTKSGTQVVSFGSVFTENFTLTTEWQRISLYEVENDTTAYLRLVCNDAITLEVYAAQLEQGLIATDYIETGASTAQAGILEDMPRLDYSGDCPSLLLEPQRSNLYLHSEYISNFSGTETFNSAISPEGVSNAVLLTKTSDSDQYVNISWSGATLSTSTDYTLTAFVKHAGDDVNLRYEYNNSNDWGTAWNALFEVRASGVTASTANGCTSDVEDYGNDWYRIIVNVTTGSSITPSSPSNLIRVIGDNTEEVLIYGVQFEQGSYPTSYIPTYGASVTRSSEHGTATNANDFTTNSCTLLIELDIPQGREGASAFVSLLAGSTSVGWKGNYVPSPIVQLNGSGTISDSSTFNLSTGIHKLLFKWDNGTAEIFIDGVKESSTITDSSAPTTFTSTKVDGGGYRTLQKQLVIFPTVLSDDECIQLTTI